MDSIPTDKLKEADKLRRDIDEYLAGGGKINVVGTGDTGLDGKTLDPYHMANRTDSRRRAVRNSIKARKQQ